MRRRHLLLVAFAAVLLAGCIGMDADSRDEGQDLDRASAEEDDATRMTADASEDTDTGVRPNTPPFYATRTVTVTGDLLLAELPIDLATEQGDIQVETGPEDTYELHVELTGYGYTPQQAEEGRDRLALTWDIGEPGDRRLHAHVEQEEDDGPVQMLGPQAEGTITLTVPNPLLAHLVAASSTGDVTLDGLQAHTAHAATSTGNIQGDLEGTRTASFETSTGTIDMALTPGATGSISATTSTGDVNIGVPETSEHGYQANAATSTGDIDFQLQDGETNQQDGPGSAQAQFLTTGFADRDVKTTVNLATSTADITLYPS